MTNLRQAAQQAILLCEWIDKAPHERGSINGMAAQVKHTLEQALAEPDSDYERGFVDGMNLQTKGSVDKAVNRMAQTTHWKGCEAVHPECKTELERKSNAIQRLWKERDELRALNAELAEALRGWMNQPEDAATYDACMARAEAALAKVEANNGS